jgi:hypothetical protein
VERVLPEVPIRQYVLSPSSELVGLLAARREALSALGRSFIDSIFRGIQSRNASGNLHCGAVVFVKPFTKALGVYPNFHALVLDGGYLEEDGDVAFVADLGPREDDLLAERQKRHHGARVSPVSARNRGGRLYSPRGCGRERRHEGRRGTEVGFAPRLRPEDQHVRLLQSERDNQNLLQADAWRCLWADQPGVPPWTP